MKLEITKNYYRELKKKNNVNFQSFIFNVLFLDGKAYRYLIEKISRNPSRYPIIITDTATVIYGGIDIYLSPELYAKNRSFLRNLRETGQVNVTSSMLTKFRMQLNDQDYSVSKIFGFRPTIPLSNVVFKKDDFVLPDFKIDMTIKSPTTVNGVFKKTLEFSYSLLHEKTKIKEEVPEKLEDDLQVQSGYIKKLSQKVNLKSLTHTYENFFLYDLDNVIKPTFTTELQKEFSIHGLISFSGETKKDNKLELVSPQNKLKFEMIKDTYKNDMKFELSKVHTKKNVQCSW